MVDTTMDALAWVRKQVEQADTDLLREMVKLFCERVMGEEADAICGAYGTPWPKSIPGICGCDVNVLLAGSLDDLRLIIGGEDMALRDYTDGWDAFVAKKALQQDANADFKKGCRAARFAASNPKPGEVGAHPHEPEEVPHVHTQAKPGLPASPTEG